MVEKIKSYIHKEIYDTSLEAKLLLLWLLEPYYMTVTRFVLHRFGIDTGAFREVTLLLVSLIPIIFLLANIKKFEKKQYMTSIALLVLVVVVLGLTVLVHPDYIRFFTKESYGITRILRPDAPIYAFLFISLCKKADEIADVIEKYCILDFVYMAIVEIAPRVVRGYFEDVDYLGQIVQRPYSLSFGYSMVFPTIAFIYFFMKRKNWLYIVGAAVGVVTIFQYGNRGAWMLIWLFLGVLFCARIFHSKDTKMVKKVIGIAACGVGVIFMTFTVPKIVGNAMMFVAEKTSDGKEIKISRTAEYAAEGNIADGSGRDEIWEAVVDSIKEGSIFGNGLYGDRPVVEPIHYVGYCHNIILEMVSNFGIFGVLILLKLILDAFRMIFLCKDKTYRELYIMFFVISCQLFLSYSFWYVFEFWIMAGLAHNYIAYSGEIKTLGSVVKEKISKTK